MTYILCYFTMNIINVETRRGFYPCSLLLGFREGVRYPKENSMNAYCSLLDNALPAEFCFCFVQAPRLPDVDNRNKNENAKM